MADSVAKPPTKDCYKRPKPNLSPASVNHTSLLFIAFGYAVGWALGGPTADTRPVLGVGTAQRNIAAALVVGDQTFNDPSVVVMVIVVAIVSLLVLLPMSRLLARKGKTPA
jgi:bile acid:Na+ symporter, BASS family